MKNFFLSLFLITIYTINTYSQDFEVAPVKIYFAVDAGATQTKIISIKNHSSSIQKFTLSTEDYIITRQGVKENLPKNSTKSSCADWISFDKNYVEINPNESFDIKVTMMPPSNNMETRWANIYVQTNSERTTFDADKKSTRTGINLSGRIAIQVIRNSAVQIEPVGKITELKEIEENKDGKRVFSVLVKNEGNTIFTGKIMFVAANLVTVEEIEFDGGTVEVYPGFSREIEFILPDNLAQGEYSLAAILDYGSKKSLEGTRLNKKLIIVR